MIDDLFLACDTPMAECMTAIATNKRLAFLQHWFEARSAPVPSRAEGPIGGSVKRLEVSV